MSVRPAFGEALSQCRLIAVQDEKQSGTNSWHVVRIVSEARQIDRLLLLEGEVRGLPGEGWGVDPLRGLQVPHVAA